MKPVFTISLLAATVVCVLAQELDIDDPKVKVLARVGAKHVSEELVDKYHHALFRIMSVTQLKDAIMLKIALIRTKCLKSEVSYDQIDECEYATSLNSRIKICFTFHADEKVLSFACYHVKDDYFLK